MIVTPNSISGKIVKYDMQFHKQDLASGLINTQYKKLTTQPPIQWVLGALSPGGKADCLPLYSAKIKSWWSYISMSHTSS